MLEVIEAGLLSTVQGRARQDAIVWGVPAGGAVDTWALGLANALLGNELDAPAIEMTMTGVTVQANDECWLAVAGASMEAHVEGRAVDSDTAIRLRPGQRLRLGPAAPGSGARSYLALPGGIDVPDVLGSPSTCLVGRFGGLGGRPLQAGDRLSARLGGPSVIGRRPARMRPVGGPLRVVRGPHLDVLPGGVLETLLAARLTVSARGDRQGITLTGAELPASAAGSIVSQPMTWGAIQLPPDGQPIALLADHQTVGGYPVAAVVIGADLPRLGQLGPGDDIRLVEVSPDEARAALVDLRREMAMMREVVAVGD